MPAHTDPDEPEKVVHWYMRDTSVASARAPLLPYSAGNQLFVCTGTTGGNIMSVNTATASADELKAVVWRPSDQLHWTDSHSGATNLDRMQVRGIPFNNRWIVNALLKEGGSGALIRLAPTNPAERNPICCSVCAYVFGSPHRDPSTWMNHFGAAVQASLGEEHCFHGVFVCFDCCVEQRTRFPSRVFREAHTCGRRSRPPWSR